MRIQVKFHNQFRFISTSKFVSTFGVVRNEKIVKIVVQKCAIRCKQSLYSGTPFFRSPARPKKKYSGFLNKKIAD